MLTFRVEHFFKHKKRTKENRTRKKRLVVILYLNSCINLVQWMEEKTRLLSVKRAYTLHACKQVINKWRLTHGLRKKETDMKMNNNIHAFVLFHFFLFYSLYEFYECILLLFSHWLIFQYGFNTRHACIYTMM